MEDSTSNGITQTSCLKKLDADWFIVLLKFPIGLGPITIVSQLDEPLGQGPLGTTAPPLTCGLDVLLSGIKKNSVLISRAEGDTIVLFRWYFKK